MEAPKANPKESTSKADSESGQESEHASEDRAWRLMDLLRTQNRTSYRPILPKPTNIEIEQSLAKEQSRVEEQRQMKHQKWVEYQRQVEYQRWAEYQRRVEDQKCQTVQNAAALEARNIIQSYHLRSFPALSSWDEYHHYAATNVAALEARDIVQPDPESSSNHSSWNANQGHAAGLADADLNQPASDSMDSQAEDQGHHVTDDRAVVDGMDVVRSYPDGDSSYPSPPTGEPTYDTHTSPYFGDALTRVSRSEDFTTMEDLLEYERQQYPSIRYFKQPVRNPVTGMWTILDVPIVQCRPLAGKAEDEFDMPGPVEGTDMPLAPRGEGSARPDRGLHRV